MTTHRRNLLLDALLGGAGCLTHGLWGQSKSLRAQSLRAGQDRFGEHRTIGVSTVDFKVGADDTRGALFVIEHKHTRKGGPARHLHRNEDEWFYVLEGDYVIETGGELLTAGPGDSVLVPRGTPHTYAFNGKESGRLLIAFSPAGSMEAIFRAFKNRGGAYTRWDDPEEQKRARQLGMELLGPPITLG